MYVMYSSMQVDLAWDVGHKNRARLASNNAKNWAIGAIIIGVIIVTAIVILNFVRVFAN